MRIFYLIIATTLLLACSSYVPKTKVEFEGVITYSISARSKNYNAFSDDEIQSYFGDSVIVYYKKGKLRMTFNGKDLNEVYYFSDSNIEYTLRNGIDTLFYGDCSQAIDKFEKLTTFDTPEKLLGLECKGVEITSDISTRTYLYSENHFINPKYFENYHAGNSDKYYANAQAPFLSYVYDGTAFQTSYRVIKLESKQLDDHIFELPSLPKEKFIK